MSLEISKLTNDELSALLSAVDNFNTEVVCEGFGTSAKAVFGEAVIEAFDKILIALQDEWDIRNAIPTDLLDID